MFLKSRNGDVAARLVGEKRSGHALYLSAWFCALNYAFDIHSANLSTATSVCGMKSALFYKLKSARPSRILVISVQWIATRWQAVPWRSRAITKSPADGLVFERLSTRSMPEQFGISEHHSSHSYAVCPSFPNRGLSYIRQEVLE